MVHRDEAQRIESTYYTMCALRAAEERVRNAQANLEACTRKRMEEEASLKAAIEAQEAKLAEQKEKVAVQRNQLIHHREILSVETMSDVRIVEMLARDAEPHLRPQILGKVRLMPTAAGRDRDEVVAYCRAHSIGQMPEDHEDDGEHGAGDFSDLNQDAQALIQGGGDASE